jgi:hypothetical protein
VVCANAERTKAAMEKRTEVVFMMKARCFV